MKKFLIVKTSAIGDVITSFDALAYLKNRFPDAEVDWVVEKAGATLLQAHPLINRILVCDTKKWRKGFFTKENLRAFHAFKKELQSTYYDAVFDLQGNSKSAVFTFLAKSRDKVGFCFKTAPEKPNTLSTNRRFTIPKKGSVRSRYLNLLKAYFSDSSSFIMPRVNFKLKEGENRRLEQLLTDSGEQDKMKIMVAFGSNWKNKQLSVEELGLFLRGVEKELSPYFFFPYGSNKEKELAQKLAALFPQSSLCVGEMSLPFWQRLIDKMECLITMDSAALHLCGTTSTPSFSLFGPSLSSVYKPGGRHHLAVQGRCPYKKSFSMRCPQLRSCLSGACMRGHIARELISTFTHFWRERVLES